MTSDEDGGRQKKINRHRHIYGDPLSSYYCPLSSEPLTLVLSNSIVINRHRHTNLSSSFVFCLPLSRETDSIKETLPIDLRL